MLCLKRNGQVLTAHQGFLCTDIKQLSANAQTPARGKNGGEGGKEKHFVNFFSLSLFFFTSVAVPSPSLAPFYYKLNNYWAVAQNTEDFTSCLV